MSSRKPGYVIGILLLAVVLLIPQVQTLHLIAWRFIFEGASIAEIGGFRSARYGNLMERYEFWQGKFISYNGYYETSVTTIDPETGAIGILELGFAGENGFAPITYGNRLWFGSDFGKEGAYEVVDGSLKKSNFVMPTISVGDAQRFLLEGDPAFVSGFDVWALRNGVWKTIGTVDLPKRLSNPSSRFHKGSLLQVYHSNNGIHVFRINEGQLLYHNGLEIVPVGPSSVTELDKPDEGLLGWSAIREKAVPTEGGYETNGSMHGLLIDDQPAALIVDDISSGNPIGHLFRFDGANWNEIASQPFPFGSIRFRTVTNYDQPTSYVVATSSSGIARIFAIDAKGFRMTKGAPAESNPAWDVPLFYSHIPEEALEYGIIFGLLTWLLMWWYTKPDYAFGLQTVKLASLGRRGIARLIDLSLIGISTNFLGWIMTLGFDWTSFTEALIMKIHHPTITVATRVAMLLAVWLCLTVIVLLTVQAIWGVTPGKWLCGLRAVRTSLRPPGFARSLAREIVFFVDCANFLCWTPGILSIAFTDRRQRLGDLVADTIVIERE